MKKLNDFHCQGRYRYRFQYASYRIILIYTYGDHKKKYNSSRARQLSPIDTYEFWNDRLDYSNFDHVYSLLLPKSFLRVESIVCTSYTDDAAADISYVMTHRVAAIVYLCITCTQHSSRDIPLGLHHMDEIKA